MSHDLIVNAPLNDTLQDVSAGGVNSPLYLSKGRVEVIGGGTPPLFVQGASSNYAMLGLKGDGAAQDWQVQATDTTGSVFQIAYSQNNPKLILTQTGDLEIKGKLTAAGLNVNGPLTLPGANLFITNLPKLPTGTKSTDVVVGADGRLYRQDDPRND